MERVDQAYLLRSITWLGNNRYVVTLSRPGDEVSATFSVTTDPSGVQYRDPVPASFVMSGFVSIRDVAAAIVAFHRAATTFYGEPIERD